jgi:hypothetical protein
MEIYALYSFSLSSFDSKADRNFLRKMCYGNQSLLVSLFVRVDCFSIFGSSQSIDIRVYCKISHIKRFISMTLHLSENTEDLFLDPKEAGKTTRAIIVARIFV